MKSLIILTICVIHTGHLSAQNGTGLRYGIYDTWQEPNREPSDATREYRIGKVLAIKIANPDGCKSTKSPVPILIFGFLCSSTFPHTPTTHE